MAKNKRTICVTSGIGEGQTILSAFDAALWDAGIANFNLLNYLQLYPLKVKLLSKTSKIMGKEILETNSMWFWLVRKKAKKAEKLGPELAGCRPKTIEDYLSNTTVLNKQKLSDLLKSH